MIVSVVVGIVHIIVRLNIIIAPNGHGQRRFGLVRWIAIIAMALVGGFRWELFAIASRAEHSSIWK